MKNYLLMAWILFFSTAAYAQKPAISEQDLPKFDKQPGGGQLSPDAKTAIYLSGGQLCIVDTKSDSTKAIPGVQRADIINRDRIVYLTDRDTLTLLNYDGQPNQTFEQVKNYQLDSKSQWLSFLSGNRLIVINLYSGKQLTVDQVNNYAIRTADQGYLLLRAGNGSAIASLSLRSGKAEILWRGAEVKQFSCNKYSRGLIFTGRKDKTDSVSVWHVNPHQTIQLLDCKYLPVHTSLQEVDGFGSSPDRLYIELQYPASRSNSASATSALTLRSYTDHRLFPDAHQKINSVFRYYYDLTAHRFTRIRDENDRASEFDGDDLLKYRIAGGGSWEEAYWNPAAAGQYLVRQTGDTIWKPLTRDPFAEMSPDKQYVIWFHLEDHQFYSYEMKTGKIQDITSRIKTDWRAADTDVTVHEQWPYPIAGWLKNDRRLLLYDQHDIWLIDPLSNALPVNLTKAERRGRDLVYRLAEFNGSDDMLLSVFDRITKENGFTRLVLRPPFQVKELTLGPYAYNLPEQLLNEQPIKARDARRWLVHRQSETEAPNYYLTTDFKQFTALSRSEPQQNNNWLRAKRLKNAILYQPEDLDTAKKYPVIVYIYEKLSDGLHVFPWPALSKGPMNIPWMVSRDYLVLAVDIYYRIGYPGASALQSVKEAIGQLAEIPYADTGHLGIQGHSWGGYETNYIVSHCDLFKAACAASAPADFISFYGDLHPRKDPYSYAYLFEAGQSRIGKSLSEAPHLYAANSPVLAVHNIHTPLLLMANELDNNVPPAQGMELFNALRREGKPVWLLQYTGEDHSLRKLTNQQDYTRRLCQFFDHYLKDKPSPDWMKPSN